MKIFNECKNITVDESADVENTVALNTEKSPSDDSQSEPSENSQDRELNGENAAESSPSEELHQKLEFMEESILPNTEGMKAFEEPENNE